MMILSRRSESMGSLEDEVLMGLRRSSVGSKSDNTVRAMATNRKTFLETDPDTRGNSHCSSFAADVSAIATQTAIGRSGGVHTSVLAVNEPQSVRRSLLCAVSQLIPQWILTFSWSVVRSCQELCLTPMQHVLTLTMGVQVSKLAMSMQEGTSCRWQCWSVTITCMAISSRRWAELRLRGRVRAWTEACRVRANRCSQAHQELSRVSSAAWSKEGHSVGADCVALCIQ